MVRLIQCVSLSCVLLLAVSAQAAGASSVADIQVVNAWSRSTPPGLNVGVAYFDIINRGKNDRLVRASSPIAQIAEFHISKMNDGVMSMKHEETVAVKHGEPTSFSPGGRHVMLIGLKRPLQEGDSFPLVLTFATAGPLEIRVQVKGINAKE